MWKRVSLVVACFALLFMAAGARASVLDKKTTLTFSQAVEVPGAVLPAGTYVFKVLDLPGSRNVVQVFNAEENQVMATILAIRHEHMTAQDKTYVGFEERPAGSPQAVREWFYPSDLAGVEFVYR